LLGRSNQGQSRKEIGVEKARSMLEENGLIARCMKEIRRKRMKEEIDVVQHGMKFLEQSRRRRSRKEEEESEQNKKKRKRNGETSKKKDRRKKKPSKDIGNCKKIRLHLNEKERKILKE
jgi:spore cortex formation protein SpoVR/YcgB (stage V sporulation)